MPYHGFVVIDKPSGMTSHDVVNRARRIFGTKRVGHTGTLDPEATGVMVLCLGNGTRLAEYLFAESKQYTAEVTFGVETETLDIWGTVTNEHAAGSLCEADLERTLPAFRGTIYQVPPMVSALRHQGKHLYELARKGVIVERNARPVQIFQIELMCFTPGDRPTCVLDVICSTGTYIRSLAHDIGRALRVGGVMSALRRTSVGSGDNSYTLKQALTLDELTERCNTRPERLVEIVLPLTYAVSAWPKVVADSDQEQRIRNGQTLTIAETDLTENASAEASVAILDQKGELVAVARLTAQGTIQPVKVMAPGT